MCHMRLYTISLAHFCIHTQHTHTGSEISVYYDPMIGKLVTHGNTREEALTTMERYVDCVNCVDCDHAVLTIQIS